MSEVWALIERFRLAGAESGFLAARRRTQTLDWMREMLEQVLWREFSRDPAVMWTSGQWMTERTGGSDVSLTETVP